eukprot:jgi/Bigna1/60773/fgenesh1_kg.15_\
MDEFLCLHFRHAKPNGMGIEHCMLTQHFAWRCPTTEEGAAVWRCCRQTHADKALSGTGTLGTVVRHNETKKENRFKDRIILHGPASCCSMMTDCADFCVTKPATKEEQKRHWTFKRRSFAHRHGTAVGVTTGDLCWVSEGDPAGSKGDLTITRRDGSLEGMKFFERMGADGAHLCKKDPEMTCPHRKKRNQSLTQAQRQWNTEFSRHRSTVENVFSRVEQFN